MAGGDASKAFELVEGPLDQVALFVKLLVALSLRFPVGLRRDDGACAKPFDLLEYLTPNHVRTLYRRKLDAGSSPRTVNYLHVTLHKALKQTVMDGLVPRNPAAGVRSLRPEKKEITPISQ